MLELQIKHLILKITYTSFNFPSVTSYTRKFGIHVLNSFTSNFIMAHLTSCGSAAFFFFILVYLLMM